MSFTFPVFGEHDSGTIEQLATCIGAVPNGEARGALMADGHVGYSMCIGGVVGYKNYVSPSGVGYDIACGNYAVKTNIKWSDLAVAAPQIADVIERRVSFGVGRNNDEPIDDPVFDVIARSDVAPQRRLLQLAKNQLGTVGSGNHYVDVLEDTDGYVWVAVHFGSRGFGHKTATGFLNLAKGLAFDDHGKDGEMMSPPILIPLASQLGQDYIRAMEIAGAYAYAGRTAVVNRVLDILGNPQVLDSVHNHHNFAWEEVHDGETYWVVRKGATPAQPGQRGFIGGSMGGICVIVEGKDSEDSVKAMYSTVHGAGRVLSRNAAIKGKHQWVCDNEDHFVPVVILPTGNVPKDLKCPHCGRPLMKVFTTQPVNFEQVRAELGARGIIIRGAGPDESPQCYRDLQDVLREHQNTINVQTTMQPRIVVMAGKHVKDPYKD